MRARTNRELDGYQFTVRPLSAEEGGGYLVEYPDIPGCMSDGETINEAIVNGREALRDCLEVFRESGRRLPKPSIEAAQWRQRLPRTLYAKLTRQAQREGVSINSFVTAIIAEAVGSRQGAVSQRVGKRV
ncbi:MAG: type II toxin-antitoxin system HicB family antitoxin [Acidobacteria bacterium]|nr:type II toxin-antitoxin system HicB family antitoxin [Acidobacteriota bacterium]